MKVTGFTLIFLLIFVQSEANILTIITAVFKGYKMIDDLWEGYHCNPRYCKKNRTEIVLSKLDVIADELEEVNQIGTRPHKATMEKLHELGTKIEYEIQSAEILTLLSRIDEAYTIFLNYFGTGFNGTTPKHKYYDLSTVEDFAKTSVSHNPISIRMSLEHINKIINRPEMEKLFRPTSFFQNIRNYYENGTRLCELDRTVQQLIFDLYTTVQTGQLKAYSMVQVSWMFLQLHKKGNFSFEASQLSQKYKKRLEEQALTIVEDVSKSSNVFMKCDPDVHKPEVTFEEVTRFMQGYLVNEIDLNRDEKTCKDSCSMFNYARQTSCENEEFCLTPMCRGDLYHCVQMDEDMDVCPSYQPNMRRYDWVEYTYKYEFIHTGEKTRFGLKNKSCQRAVKKANFWFFWGFECRYCLCYCDNPNDWNTHRFFNLREVTSDVDSNKVVTGVKMLKNKKMFHIQIQQGKLGEKGVVETSSVEWKPIDTYEVENVSVSLGKDYHMLLPDKNGVDLDDLHAPKDHVVTGLRLRVLGGDINLEMRVTKFNFSEGKLIKDAHVWVSNDNTAAGFINPRTEVILNNPGVPTSDQSPSEPDSTSNQFVKFVPTDILKDLGQTTVPFIDVQGVAPDPPSPLSGIGLYHKGNKGSGGFIAMRVFTHDYSKDFFTNLPNISQIVIEDS